MRVNTNISGLGAHRHLGSLGGNLNGSMQRLASGQRINRAADDAAGLAISEGMRNQIRGLNQATRNVQDGISLVQTAEGALEEIHRMQGRIRQLTHQASSDTYMASDRTLIYQEIELLLYGIESIVNQTEFNGLQLLNGLPKEAMSQLRNMPLSRNSREIIGMLDEWEWSTNISVFQRNTSRFDTHQSGVSEVGDIRTIVSTYTTPPMSIGLGERVYFGTVSVGEDGNFSLGAGVFTNPEISARGTRFIITAPDGTVMTSSSLSSETSHLGDIRFEYTAASIGGTVGGQSGSFHIENVTAQGAGNWRIEFEQYGSPEWLPPFGFFFSFVQEWMPVSSQPNDPPMSSPSTPRLTTPSHLDRLPRHFEIQSGANSGQRIAITIDDMSLHGLGLADFGQRFLDLIQHYSQSDAGRGLSDLLDTLDHAITKVSAQRANLGAIQNRLEHTLNSLRVSEENLSAANARIRDADMAHEAMQLAKITILQQASLHMLAQANHMQQGMVERLLR